MKTKIKILLVEDDEPLTQMLEILLARFGCEVQVVHTGGEGLQFALGKKFDLIILDIGLPDISGLEICKGIKERHFSRHAPVILMSGGACAQDIQRGFALGVVDYIAKPFGVEFAQRILSYIKLEEREATALEAHHL